MRVLGLDPGTSRFGWGIVTAENGELTSRSGVVEQPRALSKPKRIYAMWCALSRLDQYGRIDLVVIEKGFAGPRSSNVGVMAIGEARGIAYCVAGLLSAPVEEITPATMKKSVTGYGASTKEAVQGYVNRALDLKPPHTIIQEDEADAVGLALAALHARDVPELTEARLRWRM